MATYNQSVTGFVAGNAVTRIETQQIPDASMDGDACTTPGGMTNAMNDGDYLLCKGPDGGLHWYKYDAERSTVANPVLLFVGP